MSTLSQFFPAGGNVPSNAIPIELLVVGGGGGTNVSFGGGGGGRVIHIHGLYVIPGVSYNVTVGAGGAANTLTPGGTSSFGGQIFAVGGGVGGYDGHGGSGGGGSGNYSPGAPVNGRYALMVGNDFLSSKCYFGPDTVLKDLGNPGGEGYYNYADTLYNMPGGGGGAGSPGGAARAYFAGSTANPTVPSRALIGNAGLAYQCDITGTAAYYGGGGVGYNIYFPYPPGAPLGSTAHNASGAANTGAGAGAANSLSGGSGIVVVAYSSTRSAASTTGSPATPTRTNHRVYQFTGSGSITFA